MITLLFWCSRERLSLAAQVPLDLKKASEITPVWVCLRRVVVPNLGWHVGSLHGAPGRIKVRSVEDTWE